MRTATTNNFAEQFKTKAMAMNSGIKLAVGRTKGEDAQGESTLPLNEIVTLNNFEFAIGNIDGKESEFVAFTLEEEEALFYFGGSVITDTLKKFTEEDLKYIQENGVPVKFEKKQSKNKKHQDYTKITFYPETI